MAINNMAKLHQGIAPKDEKEAIAANPEHKLVVQESPIDQPSVLAIDTGDVKSQIMLKQLKERGIEAKSIVKVEGKNLVKEVKEAIKAEKEKQNDYQVVYIPVTNTDINKNNDILNIRLANIGVIFYFDGHEDQYIANEKFRLKL